MQKFTVKIGNVSKEFDKKVAVVYNRKEPLGKGESRVRKRAPIIIFPARLDRRSIFQCTQSSKTEASSIKRQSAT